MKTIRCWNLEPRNRMHTICTLKSVNSYRIRNKYLLNHNIHTPRNYTDSSKRFEKDSLAGDKFFENKLNDKEGRFVDVTSDVGIFSSFLGYGLAITTADINNDGWTDIYVGNDFHENDYVYINQKNKTFKESGHEYLSNNSRFTMGVDIADMNNDMLYDICLLYTSDAADE